MTLLVIILMASSVMLYPIAMDVKRHGSDNILKRSAQDLAEVPSIAAMLASIRSSVDRVVTASLLGVSSIVIIVVIYAVWHALAMLWNILR